MAGLTPDGFTTLRYPEIIEDLQSSEKINISQDLDFKDSSFIGQLNAILSDRIADLWELAEAVDSNFKRTSAEGRNLEDLGDIIGLTRIQDAKSFGDLRVTGQDGSFISQGTIFKSSVNNNRVVCTESTPISTTLCYSCIFSVAQVLDSTAYTITINDTEYTYNSDGSATEGEILAGIDALIDGDTNATWSSTVSGSTLIISTTDGNEIEVFSDSYLSATSVTKVVPVEAEFSGPLIFPANTVTLLVSSVSGITSINNPSDFVLGRDIETDEEFRDRFSLSSGINGKSTLPAIQGAVLAVDGVSALTLLENQTAAVDSNGLPAHSFEVIVQGGTDAGVGKAILDNKPAGIATYGSSSVNVYDEYDTQRTINFTRPSVVNFALQITYTLYDEEVFPDNGDDLLAARALEWVNSLGVNKDVIPKRLYGPLYSAVEGIEDITVEIQTITNPGDTPSGGSWVETPIEIDIREYASTTLTDINIVGP